MFELVTPVLIVVFVWWASTAAVLWFSSTHAENIPGRLMIATLVAALGFAAIIAAPSFNGIYHPLLSFAGALAIWAWVEFTFLTGLLTGTRTAPCPPNISEWTRFRLAFRTINHHEYALVAAMVFIGAFDWVTGSPWAISFFALLWLMRISAKLTIFNGAPSLAIEMMPEPIAHLKTYFRDDRIGPVFWVSTVVSTGVLVAGVAAFQTGLVDPHHHYGAAMLLTLFALAALEHWLMILPVGDAALWLWAKPANDETKQSGSAPKAQREKNTQLPVPQGMTRPEIMRTTSAKPL